VDLSAPLNLTRRTRVYAAGAEASNKWNGGADARAYFSIREPSGVNKRRRMMYSVPPPSVIRSEPEFTMGRNATVVTATSDGISPSEAILVGRYYDNNEDDAALFLSFSLSPSLYQFLKFIDLAVNARPTDRYPRPHGAASRMRSLLRKAYRTRYKFARHKYLMLRSRLTCLHCAPRF